MARTPRPAEDRFFGHVEVTGFCWLWTGKVNEKGYGRFGHTMVHRWVYEFLVGEIGDGLVIDHLCRIHRCVNPDHLEPVTRTENNRRGFQRSAVAARTNLCFRGHPLEGDNLAVRTWRGKVQRFCRTCQRDRDRQRYAGRTQEQRDVERAAARVGATARQRARRARLKMGV